MKLEKIGTAISASLLAVGLSVSNGFSASAAVGDPAGTTLSGDTPELQSAQSRVEQSKSKLEQAKQQLSAAKAMLKAADAEYRAARADQEALSLRTQARKLADASGLQDTISTGTRLYPANLPPSAAPATGVNNMGAAMPGDVTATSSVTATETVDYGAPQQPGAGAPVAGGLGAPTP